MKISYNKQAQIMRLCTRLLWWRAPVDTGNLHNNAIKCEYQGNGVWTITIDEEIAPYMKYTEENWSLFRPPLHGKQNPNEAWFEHAVGDIAELISLELGGQAIKE